MAHPNDAGQIAYTPPPPPAKQPWTAWVADVSGQLKDGAEMFGLRVNGGKCTTTPTPLNHPLRTQGFCASPSSARLQVGSKPLHMRAAAHSNDL